MADAIVTHRLTKYYGRCRVVNCLDLKVPEGAVYGLLGRNGAGKSTTIKMLLGMVRPNFGRAEMLGEDCSSLSSDVRQRIAYLAEGHPQYTWMTVGEAIRFVRPFHSRWNAELLEQILDHFELARSAKIKRLSRGQQAQVALALTVAPDPELLILDDPTLGLDTVVRRGFLESMIQIIQRRGRTILFSSHILGDVERVADRIGIMVDGVLRADCPTETFMRQVCKIILQFGGQPPDCPECVGLVHARHVGTSLELVLVDFSDRHRELIESLKPKSWERLELNLEDAFIEYTCGSRRSLPIFAGGETDVSDAGVQGAA